MATEIIMPKAGMAMEEGTILKWLKAEGEAVEQGEPLLEILTDKVNMEVEAQVSGTLIKILKQEGEVVPVITNIGYIGEAGEAAPEAGAGTGPVISQTTGSPEAAIAKTAAAEAEKAEASEIAAGTGTGISPRHSGVGILPEDRESADPRGMAGNRVIAESEAERSDAASNFSGKIAATPAAKRMAAERNINLSLVRGSGANGEIYAKDVEEYRSVVISPLARRAAEAEGLDVNELTGSGYGGKILLQDVASKLAFRNAEREGGQPAAAAAPGANASAAGSATGYSSGAAASGSLAAGQMTADGKEIAEVVSYSGIRKVIGDRMVQSKFTAPHLYFSQRVNLEKLLEVRKQINEAQEKKTSVTDYIAKAVVKTLKKYPDFNVSLMGDKIVRYGSINIGIAVAAPGGLIVPVIKNANDKSVVELSMEAGTLFEKARAGKLKQEEYTGGTFTISNLGMFGIDNFTAIINQPEVGILAVSATKDEAVVVKDESGNKVIAIKPMMNITLTADHRVVDGLIAAQFVTEIQRLLENPIELLI
ncbi:2-oxo acid dehydrogenase subunit E2 [Anoxybacterium hadale]|uniref:2-oxo acid dehydrogenase subunit E2 n=1 Tax=Anoxybacterium hadale TaxID=3408580 RepID=A0ACD1AG39_9FIRM|nr:2-oxo acid dehydrogenase subunit E2 [Clostridiales bacterium]